MASFLKSVLDSLRLNKRNKERTRERSRRALQLETLEGRSLMAIDLAVISGTSFVDLTGNGLTGDDTRVGGATVQLFRDSNANGTFESGTDVLLGTATTNVTTGVYSFASTNAGGTLAANTLTAGNYFVKQLPIASFNPPTTPTLVTVSSGARNGTPVQVIDPFSGGAQSLTADSVTPVANDSAADASIVGGERDIRLNYSSGIQAVQLDIIPSISTLSFSSNLQVLGNALLQYDGVDGSSTLNATGLGGITLNGTDSRAGIQLSTRGDNAGGTAVVRVYSNATDFSTATVNIPGQTTPDAIFVPFSSFTTAGGAGANFNSVGAIEVLINGVVELQATVTVVQSLRPTTITSNLQNTTASIQVVKSTNGQDANTTTGPLLAVGSTATFTYVVTNTGGVALSNVVVRDDNGTTGNTADDFTVTRTGGDANANNILETTETWTYSATRVVTAGQYTNIGTVTALDPSNNTVTDTDPSNHFGVNAGVNVVKSTNGQDANTATGPLLAVGATATFTYVVTNTGNVALGTVVVRDDNGTTGNTADDFNATFQSGDANSNGRLDTTETWTYQSTRVVTAGQYTNIATVTGTPVDSTGTAIPSITAPTDTDPSNHFGVTTGINLVKSVNTQDANSATGPTLGVGANATFTYVLTNTGNVALGTIVVRDDNGTTGNTADDFSPALQSGDTNSNNRLDTGETWTYQAIRTVIAGQYTNIGSVTGTPVDSTGTAIAGLQQVSDTDPANYIGVTAAVNVVKSVNGLDANTTTGPSLVVGSTATFTYVVTNTGGATLGTVGIRDDNGTTGNTADDFTATLQSGDANGNGRMETTETWTFQATRTVVAGQYSNIGTVTGTPVDSTGTAIAGLAAVTDTDPANYFGVTAGINIVKSTNGQDANTGTGPVLAVGANATFTYVVTNTGTTPLGSVVVGDDNGTPTISTDDLVPSLQSGDANSNGRLDTNETWTFQATRVVTAGQYSNIGRVSANPVDSTGAAIAGATAVTDTDPSNHFGATAGINVVKSTNGVDANTGPGPSLTVGSTATFTYVVTNTGNSALSSVSVRDDNGTTNNTADDFNATLISGDANSNGRLETTETWTYQATRTVTAGLYTNLATVTGTPVDPTGTTIVGLAAPTDTDPSNHTGVPIFSKRLFLASSV
jgi:uncharacterized repeat protein (TIGR01451 family)